MPNKRQVTTSSNPSSAKLLEQNQVNAGGGKPCPALPATSGPSEREPGSGAAPAEGRPFPVTGRAPPLSTAPGQRLKQRSWGEATGCQCGEHRSLRATREASATQRPRCGSVAGAPQRKGETQRDTPAAARDGALQPCPACGPWPQAETERGAQGHTAPWRCHEWQDTVHRATVLPGAAGPGVSLALRSDDGYSLCPGHS
jgi:hypothetical protein